VQSPLTRVFVLEPSAIVRRGIVCFLADQPGLETIGASGDVEVAVHACRHVTPSVAIVGGRDGTLLAHTIRRIRVASEVTQVVTLVPSESSPLVACARSAGAVTFMTLDVDRNGLAGAILLAASGAAFTWPSSPRIEAGTTPPELSGLTSGQREVLALVGAGLPRKVIAQELGIGERTVKTHLSAIFAHLGVQQRSQAAFVAQRIGLAATEDARPPLLGVPGALSR
jgi:two-component system, NarL family, response regulator LiaR